jgi:hypothetical protein
MKPVRITDDQRGNPDEPAEIRDLTKKALHERLTEQYFLPPNNSRGVTRVYLVGVYRNQHYRIGLFDMQRFMAELTPQHMRKAPHINSNDVKAKVQVLLREHGMPVLGYPDGVIPEEGWLLQVARMLDQTNSTAIFTEAIPNPAEPDILTTRMHTAKRNAEQIVLRSTGILADPKIFREVEAIWNSHKRLTNKRREVLALQSVLQEALNKQQQEEAHLHAYLSEAATTMYHMSPQGRQGGTILDENQQSQAARAQVKQNYTL